MTHSFSEVDYNRRIIMRIVPKP